MLWRQGHCLEWLRFYLFDRHQIVVMSSHTQSGFRRCSRGHNSWSSPFFVAISPIRLRYTFAYVHSRLSYRMGQPSGFLMRQRSVRLISAAPSQDPCKRHFRNLKIPPMPSLFMLQNFLFVKFNQERCVVNNHFHSYLTQSSNRLQYPVHRTNFLENLSYYTCLRIYYKLPIKTKKEDSFIQFKRMSRKYLLSHCFYSVSEYIHTWLPLRGLEEIISPNRRCLSLCKEDDFFQLLSLGLGILV